MGANLSYSQSCPDFTFSSHDLNSFDFGGKPDSLS